MPGVLTSRRHLCPIGLRTTFAGENGLAPERLSIGQAGSPRSRLPLK